MRSSIWALGLIVAIIISSLISYHYGRWVTEAPQTITETITSTKIHQSTVTQTMTITKMTIVPTTETTAITIAKTSTATVTVSPSHLKPQGLGPPALVKEYRFGVGFEAPPSEEARVAAELGASWIRSPPILWGDVEGEEGPDFSELDGYVKAAQEFGIRVLATIWPFAEREGKRVHALQDEEAYKEFVKALVERYDGDGVDDMPGLRIPIKFWEVYDEPEGRDFPLRITGREYAEILRVTYEAVKEADPEAGVLIAAGVHVDSVRDSDFWREALEGVNGYFDYGNVHHNVRGGNDLLWAVRRYEETLREHGIEVGGIWVTETWPVDPDLPPEEQARELVISSVRCFGEGVVAIKYPLAEGKLLRAISTMMRVLGGFEWVRPVEDGEERGLYEFGIGDVEVYVLWGDLEPPTQISAAVNIYGEILDVEKLPRGEPIYLIKGRVEEILSRLEEVPGKGIGEISTSKPEEEIVVKFTNSSYRAATGQVSGWFRTGQEADMVLGTYGLDETGGPLSFDHPMSLATDGEHLVLADTRNNRVLIWNHLPDGNEPPDLVIGQPDFYSRTPGDGPGQLNWPVGVATDGRRLVVADTCNNRILIWNEFPTRNGQEADVIIESTDEVRIAWPWGVYIVDGKLIVSSTFASKVYVWNEIPTDGSKPPDLVLTGGGMFGTPRAIWSDGKRLVIVDHNIRVGGSGEGGFVVGVSGVMFWRSFPTEDVPPDFYMEGVLWGPAMTEDGKFLLLNNYGLAIWNSFPTGPDDEPDMIIGDPYIWSWLLRKTYRFDDGDGSSIAVAGGRIYISLYNHNSIVVYRSPPKDENDLPDFAIGAPDIWTDPMEERGYVESPSPYSDGEHLFAVSGFDHRLVVWRSIPDESGAVPDVIYIFPEEPVNVHGDGRRLVLTTRAGEIYIWSSLPLNGELPDFVIHLKEYIPDIPPSGVYAFIYGGRLYAAIEENLLIWEDVPTEPKPPDGVVHVKGLAPWLGFSVGGDYFVYSTRERDVRVVRLDDLMQLVHPFRKSPEKMGEFTFIRLSMAEEGEPILSPQGVYTDGEHLFVVDLERGALLIWSEMPRVDDQLPDVIIGGLEVRWIASRTNLFWPNRVYFDGKYLWVSEVKFSNRLLRFSPRP